MSIELGELKIGELIAHEVPRRLKAGSKEGPQPILSDIESPLTQELRNFFAEKLRGSLGSGYEVITDASSKSPVPGLVTEVLADKNVFVSASQQIAQHLFECQTGVSPPGLLMVIAGLVKTRPALALLKLEKETGIRAQPTKANGKSYFDIQRIKDLMLTDKTRVFKTGLFVAHGKTITVHAADTQQGFNPRTGIADFFLDFLGCKLAEEPRVTTKMFFDATERFINTVVADPTQKAAYHVALLAEIQSKAAKLSPSHFARLHFEVADRKRFIEFLVEAGEPSSDFAKDTELVRKIAKKTQLLFESGITVIGDPETFEEHVDISTLGDGRTRVKIEDLLKRVMGRA